MTEQRTAGSMANESMVVDAFGGPGGASLGLRSLGMDSVGIEWDEWACATRAAAGHRTLRADVSKVAMGPLVGRVTGLWMSPPCPTFSHAGKGDGRVEIPWLVSFIEEFRRSGWHDPWGWYNWSDQRTPLILEPLRWVEALRPDWICCEQVPPALPVWNAMALALRAVGYSAEAWELNAANYGVPQVRHRAFLAASLVRRVSAPEPTHAARPSPSLFGDTPMPWVTMAEAIDGYDGIDEPSPTLTGGGTATGGAEPIGNLNTRRRLASLLVDRRTISRGPRGTRVPTALVSTDRPSPTLAQAEKWTLHRPATTVCADPRLGEPGHRDRAGGEPQFASEAIRLTERDGAILQGFPADYPWKGNKGQRWQQIGNAVPPALAAAVVSCVHAGQPAFIARPTD